MAPAAVAAPVAAAAVPLSRSPEIYMIAGIFLFIGFGLTMVLVHANKPIPKQG